MGFSDKKNQFFIIFVISCCINLSINLFVEIVVADIKGIIPYE